MLKLGNSRTLLVLALELLAEVGDETVVEVLATKVSVTSGRLDLEDTLLDGQERHIEGSSAEIKEPVTERRQNGALWRRMDNGLRLVAAERDCALAALVSVRERSGGGRDGVTGGRRRRLREVLIGSDSRARRAYVTEKECIKFPYKAQSRT